MAEAARAVAEASSALFVDGSLFFDVLGALLGFLANEACEKAGAYADGSANLGSLHRKSLEHFGNRPAVARGAGCAMELR